jgi:hypothetical protein
MIADRQDGRIVNVAVIQKDRSDKLNGHEIQMPNYSKLKGHFDALNIGGEHFGSMDKRDSTEMFPDADESGWDAEKKQREIWTEEIAELLKKYHPSQSTDDKTARAELLERFFETRAWSRIETMKADDLKSGFEAIKEHLEAKNAPEPVKEHA